MRAAPAFSAPRCGTDRQRNRHRPHFAQAPLHMPGAAPTPEIP